jgi:hypothetical protein
MNEISSKYSKNPLASKTGVSAINVMLGIWLIISTIAIAGFNQAGRSNNVIIGIVVAILGLVQASDAKHTLWSWFNVALGVWLIISPFALGFSPESVALLHNIIVGILVGILAWSRSFRATKTGPHYLHCTHP